MTDAPEVEDLADEMAEAVDLTVSHLLKAAAEKAPVEAAVVGAMMALVRFYTEASADPEQPLVVRDVIGGLRPILDRCAESCVQVRKARLDTTAH